MAIEVVDGHISVGDYISARISCPRGPGDCGLHLVCGWCEIGTRKSGDLIVLSRDVIGVIGCAVDTTSSINPSSSGFGDAQTCHGGFCLLLRLSSSGLLYARSWQFKDVIARAQICLVQWYVSRSAEAQADIPLPSGCIVALAKRFDEAIVAGPALGSDVLIVPEAALACANLSDWTWGLHCVRMPVFAATEAVLVAPKDWRSCSLAHVLAESAKELVDGHIICRALVFSGALAILGDGHLEWCAELDHCVVA